MSSIDSDPIARFSLWLAEAKQNPHILEPTAMTLATATPAGVPSARIVLLKDISEYGFTFFSNAESRKGNELATNPNVALCFHWMPMQRQVRVEGSVQSLSTHEVDAYYHSRPRDSQIGAWASQQSRPLSARSELEARITHYTEQFKGAEVPRPTYWQGWRVVPSRIEFWTERPYRLHDREIYTIGETGAWETHRLYP
jgi:pyridoxamine 5'-phosphate oxidase